MSLCGEGSPLRLRILLTDEWDQVTCKKCLKLNRLGVKH